MNNIISLIKSLAGSGVLLLLIVVMIAINRWFFNRIKKNKDAHRISRQTIATLIILAGSITFILSLPIDKALKGQVLSFLGIIISAAIALSSTTLLGNLIAGIMNNSMGRFKNGDLIQIGDFMGRVTNKI